MCIYIYIFTYNGGINEDILGYNQQYHILAGPKMVCIRQNDSVNGNFDDTSSDFGGILFSDEAI